jgi:hypothetical protein
MLSLLRREGRGALLLGGESWGLYINKGGKLNKEYLHRRYLM